MEKSDLRKRARDLTIKIFDVCDNVDSKKGRGVLVNQVVRSSTSIGANLHEANYGASRADFINKLQIALKECYETEYWIDIMQATNCITEEQKVSLLQECGVIRRMLVKSITTAKSNKDKN
ncbi:MAG: four helix bundle protein [Clostridia bacterium]|nr:four helix bundle protein [Clostridia bacterium]